VWVNAGKIPPAALVWSQLTISGQVFVVAHGATMITAASGRFKGYFLAATTRYHGAFASIIISVVLDHNAQAHHQIDAAQQAFHTVTFF